MHFINIGRQNNLLKAELYKVINDVFDSSLFFMGENTRLLEERLSILSGTNVILCSSGTSALIMSMLAFDIGVNDEVITSTFSFKAVSQSISLLGAVPVFADIDASNFCISALDIESKISEYTKAIIAVDIFGNSPAMEEIAYIARKYDIALIEDAAQNFGYLYGGDIIYSDIAITSFYPSKVLSAYGNGGAIFTKDKDLYNKCLKIRDLDNIRSINARIDELQAGILSVKLEYFTNEQLSRYLLAEKYNKAFKGLKDLVIPKISESTSIYSLRYKGRDDIIRFLSERGIPVRVYYDKLLHEYYNIASADILAYPCAEAVSKDIFSIPFCSYLYDDEIDKIISVITEYCHT